MNAQAQRVDVPSIDPRLASFIETRDRRIAKSRPWTPTPLNDAFHEMITTGVVRVGGRSTCGNSVDPTWVIYILWNEVVRKARQLGFAIKERDIKQSNAWATKAGGWWHETEYSITSAPGDV